MGRFSVLRFDLPIVLVPGRMCFALLTQSLPGGPHKAYGRIARRVALLFLLGLINNGLLQLQWDNLRVAGVLQRIALCYGVAAVLCVHFAARGIALWTAGILLGYWGLMALVAAPGGIAGDYSIEGNLSGYVDRTYLPARS